MAFLRRLLGSDREPTTTGVDDTAPASPAEDEAAREHELLRAEAERLDDDLIQRQMRYADRSWTPPRQGGERRAGEARGPDEP
jgi:hypothetical protein